MPATVLVSMPFMAADRPSIQLGLLTAIAAEHGFPVRAVHANLDFAARIGAEAYDQFVRHRGWQLGDWLFSVAAFGDAAPDPEGKLLEEFAHRLRRFGDTPEAARKHLLNVRERAVPEYLDELVADFEDDTGIVGFSSTFQQNAASFALARRLKDRFPRVVTVFGGANFDGGMGPELIRSVDCVDVAEIGEADEAFPRLLAALAAGDDPGTVPGVLSRLSGVVKGTPPAQPIGHLDALPQPDHTDFFDRAERLGLLARSDRRRTWIPVETSRGCWWGERHHCVFCGLNATAMRFRAKSPQRVLSELAGLTRQYGSFRFACVDNIMDPSYLGTLWPAVAAVDAGYELFFEVKANLSRAQLRLLARAGVTWLQPGLESLSSTVLRAMRKGVTAAQNVNLLRWARYYGIDVAWNILWGIPGETAQDYAAQAALLPRLAHLQPPEVVGGVWLERFSPLFTQTPAEAFRHRAPELSHAYVYPDGVDLSEVAYFFDYELVDALPDGAYEQVRAAGVRWRSAWTSASPTLMYRYTPGYLQVHDARWPGPSAGTHTFEGTAADVYVACGDRPRSAAGVHRELDVPELEVQEAVTEFERRGLMFIDDGRALALALPAVGGR